MLRQQCFSQPHHHSCLQPQPVHCRTWQVPEDGWSSRSGWWKKVSTGLFVDTSPVKKLGAKKLTPGIFVSSAGYFFHQSRRISKFSTWNLHLCRQPMFRTWIPCCFLPGVLWSLPSIVVKLDPLTLAFTSINHRGPEENSDGIWRVSPNQHRRLLAKKQLSRTRTKV